jgi:hypothetical protein
MQSQKQLSQSPPPLIVAVRDLILSSRIITTARAEKIECKLLRDVAILANEPGNRAIVDLNQPNAVETAARWQNQKPGRQVTGFVAHVDSETIQAARAAGITRILPRSRFVEILPELLRGED